MLKNLNEECFGTNKLNEVVCFDTNSYEIAYEVLKIFRSPVDPFAGIGADQLVEVWNYHQ